MLAVSKNIVKSFLYYTIELNKNHGPRILIVVMYHRVLPEGHPQRLASFNSYVISDKHFSASLDILLRTHQRLPWLT